MNSKLARALSACVGAALTVAPGSAISGAMPRSAAPPQGCVLMTSPAADTGNPSVGADQCHFKLQGISGGFVVAARGWSVSINGQFAYGSKVQGSVFATGPSAISPGSIVDAYLTDGVMTIGNASGA